MAPMLPFDTPPQRICLLRLSALGDVTHAVPVLRAIQRQWPQTRVTWITSRFEHKLLSLLDGVDFVVIDKNSGWSGYWRLRRELSHETFDVMLQMQTSARANFTGACVRAQVKLGWDRGRARDLHRWFMTDSVPPARFQHQLLGHLSFARAIGLDIDEPEWNFPIGDEVAAAVAKMLDDRQRLLVIAPCSSHPARNWRAERYAAVADYAAEHHGLDVVLSGGPSATETAMGRAIEAAMRQTPLNLIGKDTLPQLVALLDRAEIVISPDSGPAHLANAMGTPVIGLHASTWSKRSGPFHSLDLCVDKFAQAAKKYRGCLPEDLRWGTRIEDDGVMDLIEVDEVTAMLDRALAD